jgi:hypothetical protein
MILAAALSLFLPLAQVQVDQKSIDDAIARGLTYLKTAESHGHYQIAHCDELILYTFVVSGVPKTDDRFQKLLQRVLSEEPTHTYRVSLQAMLLEELDRAKYQERIALCAQFLVDNQCVNGQWSYGEPTKLGKDDSVASLGRKAEPREIGAGPGKPQVLRRITIRAQRTGPADGDNSNSQYAALGLRACADAGILLPESTLTRAERWWRTTILGGKKVEKNAVASGGEEVQGWGYKKGDEPYNTMTAGGAGCLVIYDYLLKRDWKKNPKTKASINYLAGSYWLSGPPQGLTPFWYYYYLYAIERVGMLYDTALLGQKDWYLDGARWLLQQQAANGSWDGNKLFPNPSNPTYDTCFAILFLKKATKGLTVSKDR